MADITVESIMQQAAQLPLAMRRELGRMLLAQARADKPPLDKRVPARPAPDSQPAMQWLAENQRQYLGQWVALDGARLIAHGASHPEVFAAAKADGAWMPLITFIEDPDVVWVNF